MRFTIEAVSQMTGLPAATLRNWEKRYGFPKPVRTSGGHRCYCQNDIQFLKKIKNWLSEGLSLPTIAEYYQTQRKQPKINLELSENVHPVPVHDDLNYRLDLLYQSLTKYDCNSTLQHFSILNMKLSPERMIDLVYEPLLIRIGEGWSCNKISVAQEHFASNFVRSRLFGMFAVDFPMNQHKKILMATTPGERHEGGLLILAAHLKFRGYHIIYLGTEVPIEGLEHACEESRPHLICVSYGRSEKLEDELSSISELGLPVCIGGLAAVSSHLNSKETPKNVSLCRESCGSSSANFVEMILRSRS